MFQDEGRFERISAPRRCWGPQGIWPDVPTQIVREHIYAFAAVSPHDGTLDSLVLPDVNAEMMSIFLEEISNRHEDEFILIFMDRAGWHIANRLMIPRNMRLAWLPPYSPRCNPVEHIWDEIQEKWFLNRVFEHLNAVEDTLVDALPAFENHQQRTLGPTGFDWDC